MSEDVAEGGDLVLALPAEWIVEELAPDVAPIRLVMAAEPAAPLRPRWRFHVPRIVDYLIVAIFMFFVL